MFNDHIVWSVQPMEDVTIQVVAGIIEKEGRVLLARRPEGKSHGLLWEFPGGKVEPGECPRNALVRELEEELGLAAIVGTLFDRRTMCSNGRTLDVSYYLAAPGSRPALPVEHQAVVWVLPSEAPGYEMSPLDAIVARKYAGGYAAGETSES